MKKLILVLLASSFVINAFAKPNTVTINGEIVNNATQSSSGWNFITALVTVTNSSDTQYVKVAGAAIPTSGAHITVYPNEPVDYQVETSHLTGKMIITLTDSNCSTQCTWTLEKGSLFGTLTVGSSYCTQPDNNFTINKACNVKK